MKNSKKLVNLISLVVLVATNILSPLSYVTAEDDLDIGDTASYWAEQDSGWDSSAEASEWSDNNESSWTEWRNLGDAEENTQDSSATPQNDNIVTSTNLASPGPTFCRNYFWIFGEKFIEKNWKKYFEFTPKEVIERWMKLRYLSSNWFGELEIVDIVKENGNELESANCNLPKVYILTDKDISGREILYE